MVRERQSALRAVRNRGSTSMKLAAILRLSVVALVLMPTISSGQIHPRLLRIRAEGATALAKADYRTDEVIAAVSSLDSALRRLIQLKQAVSVTYTVCGPKISDSYAPAQGIVLCYETLSSGYKVYTSPTLGFVEGRFDELAWFIVAHELAHAIVRDLRIPIVGDAELAIDELAAVLLLEAPAGEDPLTGGELFLYLVAEREGDDVAYSYHGSSQRRAHRLSCLKVGSEEANYELRIPYIIPPDDPRAAREVNSINADVRRNHDEMRPSMRALNALMVGSMDRLLECEASYPATVAAWKRLLGKAWIR